MLFNGMQRFFELNSVHGRCTDVTHLAHLHDLVQRFHRLFDGCVVIPAVINEQINIVHPQPLQTLVYLTHDIPA